MNGKHHSSWPVIYAKIYIFTAHFVKVLPNDADQKGSLVAPDKLRYKHCIVFILH